MTPTHKDQLHHSNTMRIQVKLKIKSIKKVKKFKCFYKWYINFNIIFKIIYIYI